MSMIFDTPEAIDFYRLCALKAALKLEIGGLDRSRSPSAYMIIKREFGYKGSRASVLEQLSAHIETILQDRAHPVACKVCGELESADPAWYGTHRYGPRHHWFE